MLGYLLGELTKAKRHVKEHIFLPLACLFYILLV